MRTADQQAVAWFWNANAINQLNQTLRDAAVQHHMDLVDTVRLLAMGDMVSTDAGIACFDSKYHYLLWRPVTAIRADGNPADATWSPLVTTPNHPEYPSQHGCVTAALAEGDSQKMFDVVAELEPNGRSLQHFARELARHFRNLVVVKIAGGETRLPTSTKPGAPQTLSSMKYAQTHPEPFHLELCGRALVCRCR